MKSSPPSEPEINKLFRTAIKYRASHTYLEVDAPPKMRIGGRTRRLDLRVLMNEDIERLLFPIMSEEQQQTLAESGAVSFTYQFEKTENRFYVYMSRDKERLQVSAYWLASEMFEDQCET